MAKKKKKNWSKIQDLQFPNRRGRSSAIMEGRVPMTAFATVTDRSGETPSTAEPATAVRFAGTETAASSGGASFAGFPVAQSQESSGEPKG